MRDKIIGLMKELAYEIMEGEDGKVNTSLYTTLQEKRDSIPTVIQQAISITEAMKKQ